MARIRSTHPGQWCDEDFVELTFPARLLAIAVRNFCDDKGIFEWKPKTIKMQVFPADNLDCEGLLAELIEHGQVMKFQVDGKNYGAVRNFQKFQRPKKPNDVYPISELAAAYVAGSSEPVRNELPTGGEKQFQMEDVVGVEEVSNDTSMRFDEFWSVYPHRNGAKKGRKPSLAKYKAAVKRGISEQTMIDAAIRYSKDADVVRGYAKNPETWINQECWNDETATKLSAIGGGKNDHGHSKSQDRINAFIAGARGTP